MTTHNQLKGCISLHYREWQLEIKQSLMIPCKGLLLNSPRASGPLSQAPCEGVSSFLSPSNAPTLLLIKAHMPLGLGTVSVTQSHLQGLFLQRRSQSLSLGPGLWTHSFEGDRVTIHFTAMGQEWNLLRWSLTGEPNQEGWKPPLPKKKKPAQDIDPF